MLAGFLSTQMPADGEEQVSIYAELTGWSPRLGAITVDDLDQSQIGTRLQALLTLWLETGQQLRADG